MLSFLYMVSPPPCLHPGSAPDREIICPVKSHTFWIFGRLHTAHPADCGQIGLLRIFMTGHTIIFWWRMKRVTHAPQQVALLELLSKTNYSRKSTCNVLEPNTQGRVAMVTCPIQNESKNSLRRECFRIDY